MELRTLRYFLTAAQEENITRAAEQLHLTQPTLSRQLMDLERELGVTLMIRGKKGLTLTDDGMLFRQRAEEIVKLADRLEQTFVERNAEVSGVISIGATESVGSRLFAKMIQKFSEKYPLVQFHLYNEMADYIKERLDKGLYDYLRLSQKETWGILVRNDHPLSARDSVAVEEIVEYPLILPLREPVRAEILNWLKKEEKDLKIPLSYTLIDVGLLLEPVDTAKLSNAVLLVEEGMGCAFCLDGALAIHSSPRLKFLPICPEHSTRSVLVWKKNRLFSPACSLFIQEINMLRANADRI